MSGTALDVEGPVLAEVFAVALDGASIVLSGPCGPAAWHIEVEAGADPTAVVREVVTRVAGEPLLLHSTSWRTGKGGVMLTFLAVLGPEQVRPMGTAPVERAELARGDAAEPPAEVEAAQVLEHALRHLAWLVNDDPVVARTLGERWRGELAAYTPEPFRAGP